VFNVSGALSRDELIKVTNSLTPTDAATNVDKKLRRGLGPTTAEIATIAKVIGYQPLHAANVPDNYFLNSIEYKKAERAGSCERQSWGEGHVTLHYSNDNGNSVAIYMWKTQPLRGTFEPGLGVFGTCSGQAAVTPIAPVRLTSGAFNDLEMQGTSDHGQTMMWGTGEKLALTVNASAPLSDITQLANSLQRF
jgi:hypothetical protein